MERRSRDTPVTFELALDMIAHERRRAIWRSLLWAALAGAIGSTIGALAMGSVYLLEHVDEDVEWSTLALPFLVLMVLGGFLAGAIVRLGVLTFDRRPVLAGAIFGALGCMLPGALAARQFGLMPLPFIGATGLALATIPATMILAFATARDGEPGVLRPALVAGSVTLVLAALIAVLGTFINGPPLLEILRAFLFLGIEKVGTLVGALVGFCIGLSVGLSVQLTHRLAGKHHARPSLA